MPQFGVLAGRVICCDSQDWGGVDVSGLSVYAPTGSANIELEVRFFKAIN